MLTDGRAPLKSLCVKKLPSFPRREALKLLPCQGEVTCLPGGRGLDRIMGEWHLVKNGIDEEKRHSCRFLTVNTGA
jgi:hypothetical protein